MASFKLDYTGKEVNNLLDKLNDIPSSSELSTKDYVDDMIEDLASEAYVDSAIENYQPTADAVLSSSSLNPVQGRTVANNLKKVDRYNEPYVTNLNEDQYVLNCSLPFITDTNSVAYGFNATPQTTSAACDMLWSSEGGGSISGGNFNNTFGDQFLADTGYEWEWFYIRFGLKRGMEEGNHSIST